MYHGEQDMRKMSNVTVLLSDDIWGIAIVSPLFTEFTKWGAGVWIGIGKIQSQPTVTVKSVNPKKKSEWGGFPSISCITPYKRSQKQSLCFFPPSAKKSIHGAQVWGETRLRVHLSSLILGFLCEQVSTVWTWYRQVPSASAVQKTCQWAFLGLGCHHKESGRLSG